MCNSSHWHATTRRSYIHLKNKFQTGYKKFGSNACSFGKKAYLCNRNTKSTPDSVAQLVEQMTLNHWVESSSLSGVTHKSDTDIICVAFFIINQTLQHNQRSGITN